jgi:hypothetical protein
VLTYNNNNNNNNNKLIDILELNPTNAILIIGTICEVVFVAPLYYKEPEQVTLHTKSILNAPSNWHSILQIGMP